MRNVRMFVFVLLLFSAGIVNAEYSQIDLSIYGMD